VVFEAYGMPKGFDFSVETKHGVVQMGEMVTSQGDYTVRLQMPKLILSGQEIKNAKLEGRIFKATENGWVQVASGNSGVVEFHGQTPGVYRAEVDMRPDHLMRYIPGMFLLNQKHAWVYSNPIWLK
jgi:hypothetical protein